MNQFNSFSDIAQCPVFKILVHVHILTRPGQHGAAAGQQHQQSARAYGQYSAEPTSLAKNEFLAALRDRNEVLYYKLLEEHRKAAKRLALALLKYETLSAEEVKQIIGGKTLDKPTVSELLEMEQELSAETEPAAKSEPPALPDTTSPPLPEPG